MDDAAGLRSGETTKRFAVASGVTTDKVAAALVLGALLLLVLLRNGFRGALGD